MLRNLTEFQHHVASSVLILAQEAIGVCLGMVDLIFVSWIFTSTNQLQLSRLTVKWCVAGNVTYQFSVQCFFRLRMLLLLMTRHVHSTPHLLTEQFG